MSLSLESSFLTRTIIAKVSGLLSMVRSGLIIHDVVSRWRRRKDREALPTVSRVILSMSLADLGSSFIAHFIGTWMVPSGIVDDSFQIPLAAGNEATCIAQAFISSVFILSGASSNGSLALACESAFLFERNLCFSAYYSPNKGPLCVFVTRDSCLRFERLAYNLSWKERT